jgi:hypothetical protein
MILSEHKVDRSRWSPGPWDGEPDKLVWRTRAGLTGMAVRQGTHGGLCGYVALPAGHPLYGAHYHDDRLGGVRVHGGLTYAARCSGHICHEPEPGESDDVWWLGFDCAHDGDQLPGDLIHPFLGHQGAGEYRDLGYVRDQVERLAGQLLAEPAGEAP